MNNPDPDDDGWTEVSQGAFADLGGLLASLGPGRDAAVVTSGGVLAALRGRHLGASAAGTVGLNRVAVNSVVTALVAADPASACLPSTATPTSPGNAGTCCPTAEGQDPFWACSTRHYPPMTYLPVGTLRVDRERQEP